MASNLRSDPQTMFDVTPGEIAQLNDTDLRELIGRLCEAELASKGFSPVAVTWGGSQTAADGGLDVRVALAPGTAIDGFIPRFSTGFQVKTPDMARAAILAEMCPHGDIRPVIQELANEGGAYIIVSSHGSTADIALQNRRGAMRAALDDCVDAEQLFTDFYDRTRLATWVRRHPGLITWVKQRVGRAITGWRPYEAWSGSVEGIESEYLLDDKLRLSLGTRRDAVAQPVADAIDKLRDELAQPGKVVRLVGLSGVGKTRLVQALFDARIGLRPLAPSLAVYTNLSDDPDPQPVGLVSDLVANRTRAVLIVDNCPPLLHSRLSDLCTKPGSGISLLTVEYDVRDDQPEGTQVVTLETSSSELIEILVARRYPHLSQVDARTIAGASGGNARIAIALAGTVERSETIAGLSDNELFMRLFHQRHDPSDVLLGAAQALSLVYSFQGEALDGADAELPRLAALADESPRELYRCVSELLRRDLVQKRGVWRAVLPHAIANHLAARALEDIPYDLIDKHLVNGGTERLALSLSRRLSFLHDHSSSIAIVERWLAPGGLLGDVRAFNRHTRGMFENVAPVAPEAALATLERAVDAGIDVATAVWRQFRLLLRSLAYDPNLFERCAHALSIAATLGPEDQEAKESRDTFSSLFTIYLSGTHATIEQRLSFIGLLLRSGEPRKCSLGLAALERVFVVNHFSSAHRFEFGARSRDYGSSPATIEGISHWYCSALDLLECLVLREGVLRAELRELLGRRLRSLWLVEALRDKLEILSREFAADGFWPEAWSSCRKAIRFDGERLTPADNARLIDLEAELRPSNLLDQIRARIMGVGDEATIGLEHEAASAEEAARNYGAEVAADEALLEVLAPDALAGGSGAWAFGRGLASASIEPGIVWARLVEAFGQVSQEKRNTRVLRGFLSELGARDPDLTKPLLDSVFDQPSLMQFFPELQSAIPLDEFGVQRLTRALQSGLVPVQMFRSLTLGRATDHIAGVDLKDLLLLIAEQPDGFSVAVEILSMRYFSDRTSQREHDSELLKVSRELLRRFRFSFRAGNDLDKYSFTEILRPCLEGTEGGEVAADLTGKLKRAVLANETYSFENTELLTALVKAQPMIVLNTLFELEGEDSWPGIHVFEHLEGDQSNPAEAIPTEVLIDWCDQDGEARYPLAATFAPFMCRVTGGGAQAWSAQAKALLANAPNPEKVLAEFVERLRPMRWGGSRAAQMETNARLLNDMDAISSELLPYVAKAKEKLADEIAYEREVETRKDRSRDERFE